MSTEPENNLSLLAPLADEYEPTDTDADRVFAKIQASLVQASPAPAPASPSCARMGTGTGTGTGTGKKALLAGLSCVALAVVGTIGFRQTDAHPTTAEVSAPAPVAPPQVVDPPSEAESAPSIPSVTVDSLPTAVPAPSAAKEVRKVALAAPSSAPTVAPPASDSLAREASLLAEARRALQSGKGDRALALLDEHARTFPNGWLASDRAAERVVVLCSLGRRDEAVREAKVFLEGRPKGPLTRRVELSCAAQP